MVEARSMPNEMSDLSKPLDEIRREVIESRNMTIKTDSALKTLHAELKRVAQQQQDFQKRSWFSSGVAYLGFIALCVGGAMATSNAKASGALADKERLEKQVTDLTAQVDKQRVDAATVASAEQKAAEIYKMMTTLTGEERLKGIDALAKTDVTKLSQFERQVLQDRSVLLRKEVGAGILDKGKAAFRKQDWPETIEQMTRFLSMNPPEDDALDASFFLGNALLQSLKFEESIKPLARFVEGDKKAPNRDFAMLLLVQAYDTVGQKDKAVEVTRDAVNQHPASQFRPQFLYRLQLAQRTPAAPAAAPATAPAAAPATAAPAPKN